MTGQGHEIASVLAVGALDRVAGLAPGLGQLLAEPLELGLELEHPAHPLEVEAGVGQLLDPPQTGQVALGEAAAAAPGA